jgi:hypothetical protein
MSVAGGLALSLLSLALAFPAPALADQYVEKAVGWALARQGGHGWDGYCLRFVCDAYQYVGGVSHNDGTPPERRAQP